MAFVNIGDFHRNETTAIGIVDRRSKLTRISDAVDALPERDAVIYLERKLGGTSTARLKDRLHVR